MGTNKDGPRAFTPPRLAHLLLRAAAFADADGLSIVGDLHEEFMDRCESGPRGAALWYWWQALSLALSMLVFGRARMRRRFAEGRAPSTGTRGLVGRLELARTSWLRDLRYGVRRAIKRPLFSIVAIGSLAIGVGACTLIYSLIDATLLRPQSGINEASRIVELWRTEDGDGLDTLSYPDVLDLRQDLEPSTFAQLAVFLWEVVSSNDGQGAQRLTAMYTSANYLETLGVHPRLGQVFFRAWDAVAPATPVAIVSHRFWRAQFAGATELKNQVVRLGGEDHSVVGVLPESFKGHVFGVQPDVLLPLSQHQAMHSGLRLQRSNTGFWSVAKLAPGVSIESANTDVTAKYAALAEAYPQSNRGRSGRVIAYGPVPGGVRSAMAGFLSVLMGLVGLVLLITCANVAGMLLASAASRRREMAVRLAVGSSRGQLVRQLVCESALLFFVGGALGTLFAEAAVRILASASFVAVPIRLDLDFGLDWRVIAFTLGVTAIAAFVFGLLPALQTTRVQVGSGLRASVSSERLWMRRTLVVGQVAASMVLLVTAGLFLKSVLQMSDTATGFDARGVVTASIDLELDGIASASESGPEILRSLEQRLLSAAAVESVAFATDMPLDLGTNGHSVTPEGWPEEESTFVTSLNRVSPSYLGTLGVHLFEGRSLLATDAAGSEPVALVSREFARRAWPEGSALSRWVDLDNEVVAKSRVRIVGVIDNVKSGAINEAPRATLFLPLAQSFSPSVNIFLRSQMSETLSADLLRTAILETNGDLSHTLVLPMEQATAIGSVPQRAAAWIASLLGMVALLLSAIGLYGVISFSVASRTREIGVRLALGAWQSRVLAGVVKDAAWLALPGIVLGLIGGLAVARVARSFLVGVSPSDPVAIVLATGFVALVLLGASLVPARKAAAVDPASALRSE